MVREVIGSIWDRTNRNNINNNFEELFNDLGTATGTKDKLDNFLNGTGVISSKMLEYGAVHGNYIRDGGIGTRHLLDSTVSTDKISDYSVTESKLGLRSVTEQKLDYNSVTNSRIADGSVSGPKIMNGSVFRSKLGDEFLFNERIGIETDMSGLIKDGTYIIDAGNKGIYPNKDMSSFVCALQVEKFEGWVHQTISRLQSPDTAYKRWVGTSSGTISEWKKIHIGSVDGGDIKESSITSKSLNDNAVITSKILNYSVTNEKLYNRIVTRQKLADNFLHNGRVTNDVPLKEILNDGLYIVNQNNIEGYPEGASSNIFYRLEVQRTEGWVKQILSELENPSIAYTRFVGASSGNTSDWEKMVVGKIDTDDIADGSITPEKLSEHIESGNRKPLKIFMVGNSFALDACDYLHHMCAALDINVTIGVTFLANAGLQEHLENYNSQAAVYNYHEYVSKDGVSNKLVNNGLSIQEMLDKHSDWDIITFQQRSVVSDDYSSYQPYLNQLIEAVTNYVSNDPKIGMLQTWANSTSRRADQIEMYEGIVSAYENAIADEGIGIFIPAGTAIQSARTNTLMNEEADELTRDGYHLSVLGKYVAGLTMFESLFSGYFKRDLLSDVLYQPEGITQYQIYKAKLAAKNAVINPMKFIEL